jgi:hypothetical protein
MGILFALYSNQIILKVKLMSSIAQQIFTIAENNENAIVTVETLRGKVVTGKVIMLDYRSFGLQHESGSRDLFVISQIKTVNEVDV